MARQVKVIAVLGHDRERVLLDEPLTIATLALIQAASPLSRMLLDGAGMSYRPQAVKVYLDGKLCWSKVSHDSGRSTDTYVGSTRPHGATVDVSSFTDVFPPREDTCSDDYEDCDYGCFFDERRADNRTAWELLDNEHGDPDERLDDALLLAEFDRPIPPPELRVGDQKPVAPMATDYNGRVPCCTTPGLPYRKPTGMRRDGRTGFRMLYQHVEVPSPA